MANRAAIVLAGGSGRRFQAQNEPWQDKILAHLDGKPLLVHAIENLQNVVDEVAICVNTPERKAQYTKVLEAHAVKNVETVIDRKDSPVNGPILAVASGLEAVSAASCLTVPADMPFLKPEVADHMFTVAKGFDVATPMWPDGKLETLVMVLERESGLAITETLCALKKPRADSIARAASKLLLISPTTEIKALDPQLRSFTNINTKEDLSQLKTRSVKGAAMEDRSLITGALPVMKLQLLRSGGKLFDDGDFLEAQSVFSVCAKNFETQNIHFWAGVSAEKRAAALLQVSERQFAAKAKESYLEAAKNYTAEFEAFAAKDCTVLAERALADKAWCELHAV